MVMVIQNKKKANLKPKKKTKTKTRANLIQKLSNWTQSMFVQNTQGRVERISRVKNGMDIL